MYEVTSFSVVDTEPFIVSDRKYYSQPTDYKSAILILCIHADLDSHPARMNKHVYTVYGGATQDQGQYVYLIDEHKH